MLNSIKKYIKEENIDTKLRYLPVVIELERRNALGFQVLEAGSGVNGISDYYKGKVVGIDEDFSKTRASQNSTIKHKRGDITNIPYANKSFKYVVCLDTLEHLPENLRKKAVLELLRVTADGGSVFLGFPQGKLSHFFEKIIDDLYFLVHNSHHQWLGEHLQRSLPRESQVSLWLEKSQVRSFKKKGNINVLVWFLIHLLYSVWDEGFLTKIAKVFKLPLEILGRVNVWPFYRVIFVIEK